MNRWRFTAGAAADYRSAVAWYERQREGLGEELRNSIEEALVRLVESPHLCSLARGVPPSLQVRRCAIVRFPYAIIFRKTSRGIRILAIAHNKRDMDYWTTRH